MVPSQRLVNDMKTFIKPFSDTAKKSEHKKTSLFFLWSKIQSFSVLIMSHTRVDIRFLLQSSLISTIVTLLASNANISFPKGKEISQKKFVSRNTSRNK